MNCICDRCFLLDERKGSFIDDSGRSVDYHSARFYDLVTNNIFKVSVDSKRYPVKLPEIQQHVRGVFEVKAGERFCKLVYAGFEEV